MYVDCGECRESTGQEVEAAWKQMSEKGGCYYVRTGLFHPCSCLFCLVYYVIPPALGAHMKFRGKRLITCPETRTPVGVTVEVKHAASTAMFSRRPDLRLNTCSRWPERRDCDQDCVLQVRMAPEDSLVRTILLQFYKGKKCVFCGQSFGEVHLMDHKPALLSPEGVTAEWEQVSPTRLPDVLVTNKPVC